jgi:hypothetical protein
MNLTKLEKGTINITASDHSLKVEIALPRFLAEQINGQSTPEDWDDALGEHLCGSSLDSSDFHARFSFPHLDEQPAEGSGWGTGAGWPVEDRGLGEGEEEPAVRRQPGRRVGGRGVRKLSLSHRGKKVPGAGARKVAGPGKKGRAGRQNTKRLLSQEW